MTSNGIDPCNGPGQPRKVKDKTLLAVNACVALAVGSLALLAPATLLEAKGTFPEPAALAMARTVGVLLVCLALLSALARRWTSHEARRGLFLTFAAVHLGLLPLDPLAYLSGTFQGLGSFVPNSLVHIALGLSFAVAARRHGTRSAQAVSRSATRVPDAPLDE